MINGLKNLDVDGEYDYSTIDQVEKFAGTHPSSMMERIHRLNWSFTPQKRKLSIKNRFSNWFEKWTGKRIGEYKNYTLIP